MHAFRFIFAFRCWRIWYLPLYCILCASTPKNDGFKIKCERKTNLSRTINVFFSLTFCYVLRFSICTLWLHIDWLVYAVMKLCIHFNDYFLSTLSIVHYRVSVNERRFYFSIASPVALYIHTIFLETKRGNEKQLQMKTKS